jgi:hypothetical protein
MATTGCGISHKDIKQTHKCNNNNNNKRDTTQKQYDETPDKYFFQNTVKVTQKRV